MWMRFSTYSDSDTHFRQPFYKHTPLTLLGLWYSVMGYPPMFRYSPCSTQPLTAHTGLPTSMHGCPPPLAWSLTLYTNLPPPCEFSHLWAYVFPLHAWPASYLISSGLNWLLWQASLLCEGLLFPLWHWLPMIRPGMDILFTLPKFSHFILHTSLPCSCGSYHFTLFESWLPVLAYSVCMDILFPPTLSSGPLRHHAPLSWMPVLIDLTELLSE